MKPDKTDNEQGTEKQMTPLSADGYRVWDAKAPSGNLRIN